MAGTTGKKIALDIDFTIAEIATPMIDMHNAANSTNYTLEDANDWYWTALKITPEIFNQLYVKTWIDNSHKIALRIDPKLLRAAEKYYDVSFLSSRGGHPLLETTVDALKKWLKGHGLADIKLVICKLGVEKSELDYDYYIDDSPHLAKEIPKYKNKFLFLVDIPHNRNIKDSKNVKRVKNPDEALRELVEMAKSGLDHK